MNILPKKRWHVRTKENIARVRKDEAEAAEKEKARQQQIKLAESEARTELLRKRSRQRTNTEDFIPLADSSTSEDKAHINFFKDVEEGTAEYKKTNKEYEKEKKDEKEKYEKQIGYLTYLGQDTNEALGKRCWYEELPSYKKNNNNVETEGEVKLKQKSREDPMVLIQKYTKVLNSADASIEELESKLDKYSKLLVNGNVSRKSETIVADSSIDSTSKKHKQKKHKRNSCMKVKREKKCKRRKRKPSTDSDSEAKSLKSKKRKREPIGSDNNEAERLSKKRKLEHLRAKRLIREKEERRKSDVLLAKLSGDNIQEAEGDKTTTTSSNRSGVKQKYNSQFNPNLAKQNYT